MHAINKIFAPAVLAASMVVAAPTAKRADAVYDDGTILQYALTLEHLERAFYRDSLNALSASDFAAAGKPDWVRERFTEIAAHEKAHVDFLTAGLTAAGAKPVAECKYNFGTPDVDTFIAISQIFEGVGVGAYLGAAPSITNKAYLGAAGSILVVETQHKTWVDSAVDTRDGFPRAFAAGLDFNQVYTLVAPFIVSCPADNAPLPFYTFPDIEVKTEGPYSVGEKIDIKVPDSVVATAQKNGQKLYAAFISAVGTEYVPLDGNCAQVCIPAGVAGDAFLIVTNGPFVCDAATVAGPALLYVDLPAQNFPY